MDNNLTPAIPPDANPVDVSLGHRTIKNSVFSLAGFVWPLLLSFVATPIIIHALGSSRFGFYALLNTALGIFGLLDFGVNYLLVKKLSEQRTQPAGSDLSTIFSATLMLYLIIGLIGLVFMLFLSGIFGKFFHIPQSYLSSDRLAFFILGVIFLFSMIIVPLSQIPYALQRNDITVKISIVAVTIQDVTSIIAVKTGHSILSLLIIQLISVAFSLMCFYFIWHRLAPKLTFHPTLDKEVVNNIGRQGVWVFLNNVMTSILGQMDKFVLGAVWGPTAVGYYATAQMVPEKIYATSFSLSHIFFPIFSEASGIEQAKKRVKNIFRRAMSVIPVIVAGLTTVVLLFGYQLIRYWVSKDFADHDALAIQLLAITYFLFAFNTFFQAFSSGMQALRFLALTTMICAVTDMVGMFVLIPKYSFNGASVAYLLSAIPVIGFLLYIERKYFSSSFADILKFYGVLAGKIAITVGLTALLANFVRPFATNIYSCILIGGAAFVLYLGLFWIFGFFSKEDTAMLSKFLKRLVFGAAS